MGDGTEPRPRLDAATLQRYQREIMETRDRRSLNELTRTIWRYYDAPKNAEALGQLRKAIEARREALSRNNPR